MKSLLIILMTAGGIANADALTHLSGDPARALFRALIQADLKTTDTKEPSPNFPGQLDIVDQKVTIRNMACKLSYDQIGTMVGYCNLRDVSGAAIRLGSAASLLIYEALPEVFSDGGLGTFTANAKLITCEIDTRISDSTGTAVGTCTLR
ncbi:MAG: hypothetical protein ACXVA9_07135 [Bdellovibrionales bacterium]